MRYNMIQSIVIEISPFMPRGHDSVVSSQIWIMHHLFAKPCHQQMAMELLIIIIEPYMMRHFNANELLYGFIF